MGGTVVLVGTGVSEGNGVKVALGGVGVKTGAAGRKPRISTQGRYPLYVPGVGEVADKDEASSDGSPLPQAPTSTPSPAAAAAKKRRRDQTGCRSGEAGRAGGGEVCPGDDSDCGSVLSASSLLEESGRFSVCMKLL